MAYDLDEARRRFAECESEEAELREEYKKDLRFLIGDQWPAQVKAQRESAGRPAHVHNRLPTYVQLISNEARLNKPQIRFSPAENSDQDTAEVLEGLARHIQYDSQASMAYETAMEYSAGGGFGYFRFYTDWCDAESFNQDLKVGEIVDPLSVYGILVPAIFRRKPRYAFIVTRMSREDYEQKYGKTDATSFFGGDDGWIGKDEIRVAEYFTVETGTKTIAELPDGTVLDVALVPEGVPIVRTREVDVDTVKICKINGHEILPGTETEWVGTDTGIPIVAVTGKQTIVDGKPQVFSLIRFMRDPQALLNYAKSRIAETLAIAPISPWLGAEGQFKNHEEEWAASNTSLKPYLQYKLVDLAGHPAPPPQRQVYEPPIAALSAYLAQEIDEMKAISGIFDASIGAQGNETSGIAIARRQQQSNSTNAHFLDNLRRAHEKGGRILAECIPRIYDSARMIRILGEDEAQSVVKINQPYFDPKTRTIKEHDFNRGKYDVVVTTGQAWSTKRLETFDSLAQLVQGQPQLLQLIGDIVFRNSDMAGANEISERFKKALPPGLQDNAEEQKPLPPQVQAHIQQNAMVQEQLLAALKKAQDDLDTKRVEMESRERIAAMQEETKRTIAYAELKAKEGAAMLEQEAAAAHAMAQMRQAQVDRTHEAVMQQQDQQHQAELQQQDQMHQAFMQRETANNDLNLRQLEAQQLQPEEPEV